MRSSRAAISGQATGISEKGRLSLSVSLKEKISERTREKRRAGGCAATGGCKVKVCRADMEAEFREIDKTGAWGQVYQGIRQEAAENNHTLKCARKPENKFRNRYRDVSPYDHSRVKLQDGDNDYINASLLEATEANRQYILAQGPLPSTIGHFWEMVWEQRTKAVVMLNRVIEKGTIKCAQYWPLGEVNGHSDEVDLEDTGYKVTLLEEDVRPYFTIRTYLLQRLKTDESRKVFHFHYTRWPDFGVPESPAAFLHFLLEVRSSGSLESDVGPPVVHCSAGIGRSGVFCLVDTCLVLLEKTRDLDSLNIRRLLLDMRQYRMGLIQTPDQLRFSYLAVIEGARTVLGMNTGEDQVISTLGEESPDLQDGHNHLVTKDDEENTRDKPPPLPPRDPSRRSSKQRTQQFEFEYEPEDPTDTERLRERQSRVEEKKARREDKQYVREAG
ncbi:PTPN1 [Branchiostoma lanceolatum]|uniref:protein-tyrosine-phosphatase n=1 Tax=Branchiostoma lanceolatum TaxID=7740 RepID=A0A8K0A7J7_BRALA|nr:PTPN1 [Branchiostoma lanceolatum]